MAKVLICDRCKRPTKRIAYKLFLAEKNGGRNDHSNYTMHADIGECCGAIVLEETRWQKRVKQTSTNGSKRQQRAKHS